jgi:amidohydrolase
MTRTFSDELPALLDAANDHMVDLRHELHRHPELSNEEHRTSALVTARLSELDWRVERCPTPTGAVATLDTGRPGRTVMIRADIDALPVTEENDLPYRSVVDGVMHACGHDVHTAALLGLADVLGRRRDQLSGRFVAVFQPAEEALGGARAMIDGGVLSEHGVQYAIGAHVTSLAPVGIVAARPGVMMSEATSFSVTLRGTGGHGAMASVNGNVILAVSALAPLLGTAVTDLTHEGTSCACSAGVLHAGTANNVVPRTATLRGTLRTFTDAQRASALGRLGELLEQVARDYGVECRFRVDDGTPRVDNDPMVTERVEASARRVVGDEWVWRIPPASPSDDMSEFLNEVPGCYLFVGGGRADGTSGMHHSPEFSVEDAALRVAAGVLAAAAVDLAQP